MNILAFLLTGSALVACGYWQLRLSDRVRDFYDSDEFSIRAPSILFCISAAITALFLLGGGVYSAIDLFSGDGTAYKDAWSVLWMLLKITIFLGILVLKSTLSAAIFGVIVAFNIHSVFTTGAFSTVPIISSCIELVFDGSTAVGIYTWLVTVTTLFLSITRSVTEDTLGEWLQSIKELFH